MIKLNGTSIIEIIIATALISVAMIAALSLMNRSQSQNTYAKNLNVANGYVTQAADWIRSQRDTYGYATIDSRNADTYCLNTLDIDFSSISAGACATNSFIPNTIYQRNITITKKDKSIQFKIIVSWQEKIARQATIEMELSQW